MANFFKNSLESGIGTAGSVAYTCPAGRTSTVIGVSVANIAAADVELTVKAHDVSTAKISHVIKSFVVAENSTLVLFGGDQKLVLEAGDFLSVTGSSAAAFDVIVSVLEQG
jgi:hypothetical protein